MLEAFGRYITRKLERALKLVAFIACFITVRFSYITRKLERALKLGWLLMKLMVELGYITRKLERALKLT